MDGRLPFMLLGVVNGLRNDQLTAHIVEAAAIFEIASRCPKQVLYPQSHFCTKKFPFLPRISTLPKMYIPLTIFAPKWARCLKITEKVSFNIASEASYVYIMSRQQLIKNAKNGPFWRVF